MVGVCVSVYVGVCVLVWQREYASVCACVCCVLGKFNGFWGIFLQLFRFVVHFVVVVAVPFLLLLLLPPLLLLLFLLLLWLCVSKFMFAGYENEMTVVNILIKSKFGFCLRYNNIFCCRCCHSVSLSPSLPPPLHWSLPPTLPSLPYFILFCISFFLFFVVTAANKL